jgi:hypothetical protein
MGRSFDEHIVCRIEMAGWMDSANPIDLMGTGLKVAQNWQQQAGYDWQPAAFEISRLYGSNAEMCEAE